MHNSPGTHKFALRPAARPVFTMGTMFLIHHHAENYKRRRHLYHSHLRNGFPFVMIGISSLEFFFGSLVFCYPLASIICLSTYHRHTKYANYPTYSSSTGSPSAVNCALVSSAASRKMHHHCSAALQPPAQVLSLNQAATAPPSSSPMPSAPSPPIQPSLTTTWQCPQAGARTHLRTRTLATRRTAVPFACIVSPSCPSIKALVWDVLS